MKNGFAISFLVACLCAPAAQAQIYELAFTDTNNATVVKSPSLSWYNPKGTITVTHIAGLDRKVKLELLQGTTVVNTQTSALLTVANRITASDGQAFYGVKFTLPAPADSNYILRSTVFDVNGVQVSSNSYAFNIDTAPPTITGDFTFARGGWSYGFIDCFGPDNIGNTISITGITDAASGLASAKYVVIDAQGVERTSSVNMTSNSPASITIGTSQASAASLAPINQQEYDIGVRVYDSAGNVALKTRKSKIDRALPPIAVEVWNSALSTWQPYATSTSYENPIKARVKFSKTSFTSVNGTTYGYPFGYTNSDANSAYIEFSAAVPSGSASYMNFQTYAGAYQNFYYTAFNNTVTLAGSAERGPEYVSSRFGLASEPGVMRNGSGMNLSHPDTFDRYEATVESRTYDQVVSMNGKTCNIPAGSTSCTLNPGYSVTAGRGYAPLTLSIRNAANTIGMTPTYLYIYWDMNKPVIDSFDINPATKRANLRVIDNDRINNWQLSMWDTGTFSVVAQNSGGTTTSLPLARSVDEDFKTKYREFNYAALADGVYSLTATATDTYGNKAESSPITGIVIDNTAPAIAFNYNGAAVPASINKITDLRVILTDTVDSAPLVTAMTLAGGPINDALQLGFSKQSNGWAPEVPRMFPTLEAGQEYTLTVTAKDAQGNSTTKIQKFGLTPANLVSLADIKTFAVAQSLKDKSDVPLALVRFKGALTDGQTQSRGNQSGYITLRSDSAFAVIFNGLTVQPGETKDVVIPLDATGQASLPIYPATSGVAGKSSYMIDIPQLTVN